jgi:peptidoglycan/LPS O-acetylase OafA/YrhL
VWLALRGRFWAGAVVQSVALLIHESCAVLTYPVFALACLVRASGRTEPAAKPPSLLPLLLPLVMAVVMAIVLASPPDGFFQSYSSHLQSFLFVQGNYDKITPEQLVLSPSQAWALGTTNWPGLPSLVERLTQPYVLPALIALLVSLAQRARLPASQSVAVAFVVFVPQALHCIAWDYARIWTYSIFLAFLAVWLYSEARRLEHREHVGVFTASLLAVAANLLMLTPLMDNEQDRMPRAVRICVMLALLAALLLLAGLQSALPLRERLRWRGRSLADLFLRRSR